jgi:hypothetical protein
VTADLLAERYPICDETVRSIVQHATHEAVARATSAELRERLRAGDAGGVAARVEAAVAAAAASGVVLSPAVRSRLARLDLAAQRRIADATPPMARSTPRRGPKSKHLLHDEPAQAALPAGWVSDEDDLLPPLP